ncbi:hypothetical protein [uncultured Dokdonia sp.]|uniref:hypothetical protein n=1 Tax=uncultured Dokdonia sp. TaxID=575653 RepID=UPI0026399D24|nr:hypothetical protein [uncultured Dokdonia sp.]
MAFSYFSSHFHVFWIPVFPYTRKGFSSCTNCGEELKPKRMPEHIRRAYKETKKDTKLPIWQFSGLILVTVLIGFLIYQSKADDATYAEYMTSPRSGDVYRYKLGYDEYSTLKIAEITEDSIYLIPNEYVTNKRSGISEIDTDANYGQLMYGYSRDEIERMFKDEEIYQIDRE